MILRLANPAARILLALLASLLATALSNSGLRNALAVHEPELNTPKSYLWAFRLEPDNATSFEHPWTSGNDVRGLPLCVSRLASAKFPDKIAGSAWIDDVSLVPQSAENTKQ
jgi:hypothetical protein